MNDWARMFPYRPDRQETPAEQRARLLAEAATVRELQAAARAGRAGERGAANDNRKPDPRVFWWSDD